MSLIFILFCQISHKSIASTATSNNAIFCKNKTDIVTVSSYKGGYLCKNCAKGEVICNIKTIKLLRMFYYVDIDKITKL